MSILGMVSRHLLNCANSISILMVKFQILLANEIWHDYYYIYYFSPMLLIPTYSCPDLSQFRGLKMTPTNECVSIPNSLDGDRVQLIRIGFHSPACAFEYSWVEWRCSHRHFKRFVPWIVLILIFVFSGIRWFTQFPYFWWLELSQSSDPISLTHYKTCVSNLDY